MKRKILHHTVGLMRCALVGISLQCGLSNLIPLYAAKIEIVQQTIVSGIVTSSEDGEPLPGVSIIVKGSTTGTTTDVMGRYKLQVEPGAVLQFSYVGFQAQEITVNNILEVNISMIADLEKLDEVVVVGYSSQSKRTITGAVSNIDGKDLADASPVSMDRAIQGKVPGVMISSEGTPGGGTMVRIRGFSTTSCSQSY